MTVPLLLPGDYRCLEDRGLSYEVTTEAGMTCVVIRSWRLPTGYDRAEADLLIRLPAGFPDVAPDMWWFEPAVKLSGGAVIQATDLTETYLGRQWQRWSRHFQPGQWRSGLDGLESYLALIWRELIRCAGSVPS
jgi:Prokaryotic E2 family E